MKRRVICFVSVIAFLFASCEMFQEPVKEYLEYWTSTIQVGTKEIASPYVKINGIDNVSAVNNNLEIYLYLINPKKYNFEPIFSLECEGESLDNSSFVKIDDEKIKITATLNDSQQGKTISLSGYILPENKEGLSDTQLLDSNPELFYSCSFIQNTAPDSVANFTGSTNKIEGKFYTIFDIPNQSLNKNKDIKYKIQTYKRDSGTQQLTLIDEEIVSSNDNKNTSNNGKFYYYSDKQEENLGYEYSVTVLGKLNLISDKKSTDPGLGNCPVNDPEFTVADSLKEITVYEGYETYTISTPCKEKTTFNITAKSDISYQIQLDSGELKNVSSIEIPLGKHTVKVISKKDRCESNTYEKKLFIQGTLKEPEIDFTNQTNTGDIGTETNESIDYTKVQFSYLNYDTLNCSINNENGTGTSMNVYLNNTVSNNSISLQPDEFYSIKVVQKKENYKTLETIKNIKPVIKPITLYYYKDNIKVACDGFRDDSKSFNLNGAVKLFGEIIWGWGTKDDKNEIKDDGVLHSVYENTNRDQHKIFNDINEEAELICDDIRRRNGGSGDDYHFGDPGSQKKTLVELKNYADSTESIWIFDTGTMRVGGRTFRVYLKLKPIEEN